MPPAELAKQCLDVPPLGRLLRFDVYDLKLHRPQDDPYNEVVRELEKEGTNRNVFLVGAKNLPIWRIADYEQAHPDAFVSVEQAEMDEKVIGYTFRGHIFEINLVDGSLTKIGWTK